MCVLLILHKLFKSRLKASQADIAASSSGFILKSQASQPADLTPCYPSALDNQYWVWGWEKQVLHITSCTFLFSQEHFGLSLAASLFEALTSRNAAEWGKGDMGERGGERHMGE